jgi:NAD(P)-dependent dehydrogenase (short-subunit alcohol dehydrogenase family)
VSRRPADVTASLVTGANRGLGLEVARQLAAAGHRVALGSRDLAAGERAAAGLRREGLDVQPVQLDVTDPASVAALGGSLERLDVLVNNAAVDYDDDQTAATADLGIVEEALATNLVGAWRVTLAVLPLLRRSRHGRIVMVSSGGGAIGGQGVGTPAYSVSKLALNGLTLQLAAELRRDGILVNAVCPGWVATDMGGRGGRPVPEGAAGITWAATLPDDGPTGGFFRDEQRIDW